MPFGDGITRAEIANEHSKVIVVNNCEWLEITNQPLSKNFIVLVLLFFIERITPFDYNSLLSGRSFQLMCFQMGSQGGYASCNFESFRTLFTNIKAHSVRRAFIKKQPYATFSNSCINF